MEFTKSKITMRTLASGNELNIPVIRFSGDPGKKIYIQANIHGSEVAGVAALYRLIPLLRQEKAIHGEITIVPSINPVGLDSKYMGINVGDVDPNEYVVGNFNRVYQMLVRSKPEEGETVDPEAPEPVVLEDFVAAHLQSDLLTIQKDFKVALRKALLSFRKINTFPALRYGLQIAMTAQEMALEADYVIDLHTDVISIYYGYALPEDARSFAYFDLPYMIKLSADDWDGVFDEAFLIPWVKLMRAFKQAGREMTWADLDKEAITLELGNADQVDYTLAQQDAERIMNYLRYKGFLDGEPTPPRSQVLACEFRHRNEYIAPVGGLVFWDKKSGDAVAAGERIATILRPGDVDEEGRAAEVAIKAARPGVVLHMLRSQTAHQGLAIVSVLTNLAPI